MGKCSNSTPGADRSICRNKKDTRSEPDSDSVTVRLVIEGIEN